MVAIHPCGGCACTGCRHLLRFAAWRSVLSCRPPDLALPHPLLLQAPKWHRELSFADLLCGQQQHGDSSLPPLPGTAASAAAPLLPRQLQAEPTAAGLVAEMALTPRKRARKSMAPLRAQAAEGEAPAGTTQQGEQVSCQGESDDCPLLADDEWATHSTPRKAARCVSGRCRQGGSSVLGLGESNRRGPGMLPCPALLHPGCLPLTGTPRPCLSACLPLPQARLSVAAALPPHEHKTEIAENSQRDRSDPHFMYLTQVDHTTLSQSGRQDTQFAPPPPLPCLACFFALQLNSSLLLSVPPPLAPLCTPLHPFAPWHAFIMPLCPMTPTHVAAFWQTMRLSASHPPTRPLPCR